MRERTRIGLLALLAACMLALAGCGSTLDAKSTEIAGPGLDVEDVVAAYEEAMPEPEHVDGVYNPLLVGDSVPEGVVAEYEAKFPYGLDDGEVSRPFVTSRAVFKDYLDKGLVGQVVIFAAFTNGPITDGELDAMYELVGEERDVFLVNVYLPERYDYTQFNNDALAAFADAHDNVHVIDWYSTVQGHEAEWLWDDHTHIRPEGAGVYVQMIADAVRDYLPPEDIAE